jgi:P-type Ca2+ transporter type 2C
LNSITFNEIFTGLTQKEIPELQKKYGKNAFQSGRSGNLLRLTWGIISEPMFIILLVACTLYFILGESREGFLMLAAMIFVSAISFYQETKSSNALAALRDFTEPRVMVIREGKETEIFSIDLLPGDIMYLSEGNRIPADAIIMQANDFTINESIITGESLPVNKSSNTADTKLYQGTTINSGWCYARVTAIGNETTLGKLGKSITTFTTSKTLLQKQVSTFVKRMAAFSMVAFLLIWFINYRQTGSLAESLLVGLVLAMSVIPEEIPVAFSSFMALGAFHMAKLGIITRQPATIENLGAVSVICLDKTGTITQNKMAVKLIYDYESDEVLDVQQLKKKATSVLYFARLASEQMPFDAMEKAIINAYQETNDGDAGSSFSMTHEYPLDGFPPMMTHVHGHADIKTVAGKGAPERIIQACRLDEKSIAKIRKIVIQMASQGYRVLGVCSATILNNDFPQSQDDFNWKFEGLAALYDPPKTLVHAELEKWYKAGIKIKLITGDYAETAINISKQVGLKQFEKNKTGEEIQHYQETELKEIAASTNLFSRMFPDAKLKIIEALKANGEIVAMMGDGVNDAPALKSSHIGIAVGSKGSEIAREASDLILTDDNLDKITEAIYQGRKIFNNLKKAVRYIISIHTPIILTAALPVILGWKFPNIFTPIHVIFLEIIMGPTCSIFYEREPADKDIMSLPPRERSQTMFTWDELLISLLQGTIIAIGVLSMYYYFMNLGYEINYIRTLVFITLIFSNIFLTFVNRSFRETLNSTIKYKNNLAPWILIISGLFLWSILYIPFIREAFYLSKISTQHFLLAMVVGFTTSAWFEVYKLSKKKKKASGYLTMGAS